MENKVVTTDEKTLASTFNKHCVNIVEITCEKIPKNFSKISHGKSKQEVLCDILNRKQIEKKFNGQNFFGKKKFFKPVAPQEIKKFIKCLDRRNSTETCSRFFNYASHCCNK